MRSMPGGDLTLSWHDTLSKLLPILLIVYSLGSDTTTNRDDPILRPVPKGTCQGDFGTNWQREIANSLSADKSVTTYNGGDWLIGMT